MNVPLLRKIQTLFREHPSKAVMDCYGELKDRFLEKFEVGEIVPMCNTHLCIGGSALVLANVAELRSNGFDFIFVDPKTKETIFDLRERAAEVLDIPEERSYILFDEENWPAQFQSSENVRGSKTLASNMVRRIEHFIETGE